MKTLNVWHEKLKYMSIVLIGFLLFGCSDNSNPIGGDNSNAKKSSQSVYAEMTSPLPVSIVELMNKNTPSELIGKPHVKFVGNLKGTNKYVIMYTKATAIISDEANLMKRANGDISKATQPIIVRRLVIAYDNIAGKIAVVSQKDYSTLHATSSLNKIVMDTSGEGGGDDPGTSIHKSAGRLFEHASFSGRYYEMDYYYWGPGNYFIQNGNLMQSNFNDCTSSIDLYVNNQDHLGCFEFCEDASLSGAESHFGTQFNRDWNDIYDLYQVRWQNALLYSPNDEVSSFTLDFYADDNDGIIL